MTTLAIDTCQRANQSGLGTASDGINVWGNITNSATANIVSNESVISNCVSGFPSIFLGSHTTADINFLVRFSQTNNVFDGVGPCFRCVDANNMYFVAAYAGSGGLIFAKLVSGGFTQIASASFTLNANTFYWIRAVMSGNHIQVRIWADGSGEPSTWNIDTTDTTYASAGRFGMSFNVFSASSDTVKFDSITVTDNQSSGNSITLNDSTTSADTLALLSSLVLADTATTVDSLVFTPPPVSVSIAWLTDDMAVYWLTDAMDVAWRTT